MLWLGGGDDDDDGTDWFDFSPWKVGEGVEGDWGDWFWVFILFEKCKRKR